MSHVSFGHRQCLMFRQFDALTRRLWHFRWYRQPWWTFSQMPFVVGESRRTFFCTISVETRARNLDGGAEWSGSVDRVISRDGRRVTCYGARGCVMCITTAVCCHSNPLIHWYRIVCTLAAVGKYSQAIIRLVEILGGLLKIVWQI